ncbi:MAG: phosphoadenosine phosphosulfate reductase family protein [Candidatus Hodarchaeota archaeon]
MGKKAPYHGIITLHWCDNCNIPLVENVECGICHSSPRKVNVSPPGDVRPAFPGDVELIRTVINQDFGEGLGEQLLPEDKLILLNKVPYVDRADEVIIDGNNIGILRYDILRENFEFFPKIEGAIRLAKMDGFRRTVMIDEGAVNAVSRGANVLLPGIVACDENVEENDVVVVVTPKNEVVAVGVAKLSGGRILNLLGSGEKLRGIAVKTKQHTQPVKEPKILRGGQRWENAVRANEKVLENIEKEAVKFIKNTILSMGYPIAVAWSGGKDSLATLILAVKALDDSFKVIFVDTGLEFPKTIEHVREIVDYFGLNERFYSKIVPENTFFELAEKGFGPPGRDARWCCKTNKLGPTNELLKEVFGQKVVTLVGQRKYESSARALEKRIWHNPFVPMQILAAPIRKWTALHVWLYIFRENVPYNPAYEEGFWRIGCWLCPSSEVAQFQLIKEKLPKLWERWYSFLEKWREAENLLEEWINFGLWRWQTPPKKMKNLLEPLFPNLFQAPKPLFSFEETEPCKDGTYHVICHLEETIDLEKAKNFAQTLGKTLLGPTTLLVYPKKNGSNIIISQEKIRLNFKNSEDIEFFTETLRAVIRSIKCTGCGVCAEVCPKKSIQIKEERDHNKLVKINGETCNKCGKCNLKCPLNRYTYGPHLNNTYKKLKKNIENLIDNNKKTLYT